MLLCAYVRKAWVLEQRKSDQHKSVDRVLITLYRNKRWRGQPGAARAARGHRVGDQRAGRALQDVSAHAADLADVSGVF